MAQMDRLRMSLLRIESVTALERARQHAIGAGFHQWQQERAPTRPGKVRKSLGPGIGCWESRCLRMIRRIRGGEGVG